MCNAKTVKYVLELGDTVNDKSDSIPFLVLCQFWNLGGPLPPSAPGARAKPMMMSEEASSR